MKYLRAVGFLTVALAALPAASHAQSAYAAQDLALLAGPSPEYPEIVILPRGAALYVQGCLSDYRWCDVVAGPHRGWAYAGNIIHPYRGANVPLATYGAALGIGVLAFSVGHYWDSHYVGRPWYPQRQLWINRPPPPHYGPGGHPPRPGYRPPGGHPPPQGHRPPDGHAPPPGARPPGGHPPPQGHRPPDAHAPPAVRPQGGRPPQQDHRDGGGQRPQKEHNQGSR
jgi:uncharacterized protein YraI